eukprot:TRINITY_DN7327_c0_g5_i1.p1 TRINITY_DN7327_c0_g5~~TRINITY_DN7327_c0_g5_i1.p1  ORF type:complete len:155 (-),score=21.74 TRINITY_DN7327_c0_g5_i1:1165-1629(-)
MHPCLPFSPLPRPPPAMSLPNKGLESIPLDKTPSSLLEASPSSALRHVFPGNFLFPLPSLLPSFPSPSPFPPSYLPASLPVCSFSPSLFTLIGSFSLIAATAAAAVSQLLLARTDSLPSLPSPSKDRLYSFHYSAPPLTVLGPSAPVYTHRIYM